MAGDPGLLFEVRDRRDERRESSKEERGTGERGRGFVTDIGSVGGTLGNENERSEVGVVESSTAAVVLVEGVWPADCCICWSWACCWRIIWRRRFYEGQTLKTFWHAREA